MRATTVRRTVIVEGSLAFGMQRLAAAANGECGLQILTVPLLAARLAGGFHRPALAEEIEPAITDALAGDGFREIGPMRELPGMTRAVARTLNSVWWADLSLADLAPRHPRLQDLALIEARVRERLPKGVLLPRDLRGAALRGLRHAPRVLGEVTLQSALHVEPVWRGLLRALGSEVLVSWHDPPATELEWFSGALAREPARVPRSPVESVSCADLRAEVVESLRWARELIVSGRAKPQDIAICAASTEPWDEHFVTLGRSATLPLHFTSGLPALASREGQACAALASVLLRGLSQERIRRLIAQVGGQARALKALPSDWSRGLAREAALFHLEDWRHALDAAWTRDPQREDPRPTLWPVLERLAMGSAVALEVGDLLLGPHARTLWRRALRSAPAQALEFSLRSLRVADGIDPAVSIVWCSARELTGSPRPMVRLLGLNSGVWPRRASEDPLLPDHLLARRLLDPDPVTQRDRSAFDRILARAGGGAVLSRSRRDAQGRRLPASPLLEAGLATRVLARGRIPEHAFSETDRLLARPRDAARSPALLSASRCWQDWHQKDATAHDGLLRAAHSPVAAAIARVQSATSLRLMLRDPLAFVWRYALGWHAATEPEEPLTLTPRVFGELVHELLRRAVNHLEPDPGYNHATYAALDAALQAAAEAIEQEWPLERSIPPPLLWSHTLKEAVRLARQGLRFDQSVQEGTRCWTEVAFGQEGPSTSQEPWDPSASVHIPGTAVRIRGRIDRLDLRHDRKKVRVSDYKTGIEPENAENVVLSGGNEVQRVIYAIAVRELMPHVPAIQARLVYLRAEPPQAYALRSVEEAIATICDHVRAACDLLEQGRGLASLAERKAGDEFRLLLPADLDSYLSIKRASFARIFGKYSRVWQAP